MHLEFHYPRRSQVAPRLKLSVYLSDAILAVWFQPVSYFLTEERIVQMDGQLQFVFLFASQQIQPTTIDITTAILTV
jgi:hypothetical protein